MSNINLDISESISSYSPENLDLYQDNINLNDLTNYFGKEKTEYIINQIKHILNLGYMDLQLFVQQTTH